MTSRRADAARVVRAVRDFHAIGRQSLKRRPRGTDRGGGASDAEAERLGKTGEFVRKARAFADRETGYDRGELDALCRAVRESFLRFADRGTRFGTSHVIRLLSVPKALGERAGVQARLFAGGWSVDELDAAIRSRYGRRRRGGRRQRVGEGRAVLDQLDVFCERWRRWHDALLDGVESNGGRQPIDELPADVRTQLTRAARAIARLQEAVMTAAATDPDVRGG